MKAVSLLRFQYLMASHKIKLLTNTQNIISIEIMIEFNKRLHNEEEIKKLKEEHQLFVDLEKKIEMEIVEEANRIRRFLNV
jgi:hypothetical protein